MRTSTHFRLVFAGLSVLILLLQGCASVPMAAMEEDANAKMFSPLPDKASIYIYRNEVFGAAIPLTVLVNGKKLGQTASKTYFKIDVLPGEYEIESVSENTSTLKLISEAAKNYFVWQEVKMGMWMARSLLQQVDDEKGRAGVTESKLIQSDVTNILPLDMKPPGNTAQKLRELNKLRIEGVITEQEFQTKKKKLLEEL
jgi:hypothetical protein